MDSFSNFQISRSIHNEYEAAYIQTSVQPSVNHTQAVMRAMSMVGVLTASAVVFIQWLV